MVVLEIFGMTMVGLLILLLITIRKEKT